MNHDRRYIFLGPPGSGKGTQAKIAAGKLNLPHIDMGSTIRAAIRNETDAGKEAKKYVDAGELVPNHIVIAMAQDRLVQDDTKQGFILDGYPRSLDQAEALENYLNDAGLEIKVINLQIPMELIVSRLTSRLLCKKCSAVYNTQTKPPEKDGFCDDPNCDGELYQRDDDKPETIITRFKTYESETAPLIEFYSNRNVLINIDATGNIDEITDKIMAQID